MGKSGSLSLALALTLAACADTGPAAPAAPPQGVVASPAARSVAPGPQLQSSCGLPDMRGALLRELNAARAAGLRCGAQPMAPAAPLTWHPALAAAAAGHSRDMAQRHYFDHRSLEGLGARQRVTREGYAARAVAENIASGEPTVEAVLRGWLASPSHCGNMLDPVFTDVGLACAARSSTRHGTYWTLVLGRR